MKLIYMMWISQIIFSNFTAGTPPLTPDYNMQTARVRGENRVLFHEEVTPTSCEQSDGVFNPEKRTVKKYKNFSYRAPEGVSAS